MRQNPSSILKSCFFFKQKTIIFKSFLELIIKVTGFEMLIEIWNLYLVFCNAIKMKNLF